MKKGTKLNKNGNPIRHKMHVKKGDTVQVITGRDKGKVGEIIAIFPKKSTVIVEGVNRKTKHIKPTQEGESGRIETSEFPHSQLQRHALLQGSEGDQPGQLCPG